MASQMNYPGYSVYTFNGRKYVPEEVFDHYYDISKHNYTNQKRELETEKLKNDSNLLTIKQNEKELKSLKVRNETNRFRCQDLLKTLREKEVEINNLKQFIKSALEDEDE